MNLNYTEPSLRASAQRYLDVLAALAPPGSLFDVRYRTSEGQLARFFTGMHDPDTARIVRVGQRTDVYVGCAPRRRRSGRREDLAATALVWVDCDMPDAARALAGFLPAPSMIVASGSAGHAHGYWALTRPLAIELVERLNRALAAVLAADGGAVTASTAILRVPGTLSFKEQPPRPVRLTRCAGRRYTLAELTAALPTAANAGEDSVASARAAAGCAVGYRTRAAGDPLLAIAPEQYVRVLTGRRVGRDQKISCPFHKDDTPSFHVYPTAEQGWTCFGCETTSGKRRGGDIYTLASLLYGIPASGAGFFELRERLDELFGVTRS